MIGSLLIVAVAFIIVGAWLFPELFTGEKNGQPDPPEKSEAEKHKDLYGY